MGDFAILKEFYAEKEGSFWHVGRFFDALLRGFGQVSDKFNVPLFVSLFYNIAIGIIRSLKKIRK